MYYGNSVATDDSSGAIPFIFFDDFEGTNRPSMDADYFQRLFYPHYGSPFPRVKELIY